MSRPGLAQTALVSSLTVVAVALLGAVLAYWTWAWFAPRAEPRIEAGAVQSGSVASAGAMFGNVPRSQEAAPTGIAIKLLGVLAASGGRRGYAMVQLEAKLILAVQEGEDIAPGIRLAEVQADHVVLERNGLRETLALQQKKSSIPPAPQAAESTALQPQPTETVTPPAVQPASPRTRRSARRQQDDSD